jgi:DNA-binding HxlR family transcriptional regulator
MYQKKIPKPFNCAILLTKEVLNGKWKTSILYCLVQGPLRPSFLLHHIPGASRRVLNVQLNEMERHGLIGKTVYPGLPLKVEYYLTDFGRTLLPIVEAMTQWGEVHRARLEQVLESS